MRTSRNQKHTNTTIKMIAVVILSAAMTISLAGCAKKQEQVVDIMITPLPNELQYERLTSRDGSAKVDIHFVGIMEIPQGSKKEKIKFPGNLKVKTQKYKKKAQRFLLKDLDDKITIEIMEKLCSGASFEILSPSAMGHSQISWPTELGAPVDPIRREGPYVVIYNPEKYLRFCEWDEIPSTVRKIRLKTLAERTSGIVSTIKHRGWVIDP